jgi:hypothetical protein
MIHSRSRRAARSDEFRHRSASAFVKNCEHDARGAFAQPSLHMDSRAAATARDNVRIACHQPEYATSDSVYGNDERVPRVPNRGAVVQGDVCEATAGSARAACCVAKRCGLADANRLLLGNNTVQRDIFAAAAHNTGYTRQHEQTLYHRHYSNPVVMQRNSLNVHYASGRGVLARLFNDNSIRNEGRAIQAIAHQLQCSFGGVRREFKRRNRVGRRPVAAKPMPPAPMKGRVPPPESLPCRRPRRVRANIEPRQSRTRWRARPMPSDSVWL